MRSPLDTSTLQIVLKKGEKRRLELTALHRDGSDFDADVALAPIMKEGDVITGMVCTFRDISPLKEVERMKDAFVSNVSHELRTPIAALRLNHYLLQKNPVKQSRYMERLKRDIDRLNALIEDLLSLSRLDQLKGELELIPVDLNVMAEQYAADRSALAESKGLKLNLERHNPLPTVLVNEGLISQSLSILLTNAFNYTPEGGQVTISTTLRHEDGQYWAGLQVRDNGPGIQPEDQVRLFERFYRGNAARESGAPGTGLGLSIAQEIVKRHQGELEVFSEGEIGKGSIFTVWLKI
jgi:signal transduction histidine kinase